MADNLKIDRQFFRSHIGVALVVITAAVLLLVAIASLRSFPGRHLMMATGPPGSAYEAAGERYREILARDGVELRLVATAGAVENAGKLSDPHSGVGVTFLQSGSPHGNTSRNLESLGTVFYEGVWVFCRCLSPLRPLRELVGWHVSIGPLGSASRPLALKLLALNGADTSRLQLAAFTPEEAEKALMENRLDAVVMLSGWESPVVQRLARAPDITLMGFPRADAYVALEPTWSKLILPRGVADLAADRPSEDIPLIASKASLAVRKDLHPALKYLLVQAAIEVHARPGMFHRAGEFPAAEEIDLPLSNEARQIYRAGPSFLQRSLPFWLADLVQRLLIFILPIAGIIYPLWSVAPRIYDWQMRRRVTRVYGELKRVERQLQGATGQERAGFIERLEKLEARVADMKMPLSYTESTFRLREHIRGLRERSFRST